VAAIIASDNVFAADSTILDGLSANKKLRLHLHNFRVARHPSTGTTIFL